ncbi:hypothetical protein SODALDRAFT_3717 [Sodiomyces alkalinus F11]|uniref:Uncharacterized protein n=1 Tax=Sodiomyces alkalinus (strain CBS 110278 / VKM F-3762 / F11) TaxID=1314773 RepID=A0A3N2Q579_SODAK|nr:hypothetical protein SODALDRAFT_3717 [Sodiomyces alkalinus F11]ROT41930.1 hypothetical protein SODALDRAFT_3717 [Sodiomyces alkalinus F11]
MDSEQYTLCHGAIINASHPFSFFFLFFFSASPSHFGPFTHLTSHHYCILSYLPLSCFPFIFSQTVIQAVSPHSNIYFPSLAFILIPPTKTLLVLPVICHFAIS